MANRPKDILLAIGSHHHAVNIRKQILTRQARSRPLSSQSLEWGRGIGDLVPEVTGRPERGIGEILPTRIRITFRTTSCRLVSTAPQRR
jgi:hypothetical protein